MTCAAYQDQIVLSKGPAPLQPTRIHFDHEVSGHKQDHVIAGFLLVIYPYQGAQTFTPSELRATSLRSNTIAQRPINHRLRRETRSENGPRNLGRASYGS